jgi:calcineurin-like phosphoesterase family protein
MDIWLTSDLHLSHANIIKYSNRPFADTFEMDAALIANWNARVGKKDRVFLLGDVFFGRVRTQDAVLDQLNGNITLVTGNHDTGLVKRCQKTGSKRFVEITPYFELKDGTDFYVMSHYPMVFWNRSHYGSTMLHGHSHGGLEPESKRTGVRRLDVGVDVHGYKPISLSEIREILKDREWAKHHRAAMAETMEPLGEGE